MVTVALIGADGAGKTTVGRRLEAASPLPIKYLYMGINDAASTHALPTTRALAFLRGALGKEVAKGGPPDPSRARKKRQRSPLKRFLSSVKSGVLVANRLCEEWYRQALAWYFQRRGYVVLFDRHFFADYYAHDVQPTAASPDAAPDAASEREKLPLGRRVHGWVLRKLYPQPDLVILLDAPAEVLLARKGEGTLELLESRRREYHELGRSLENFAVVDATRGAERAVEDVLDLIRGVCPGAPERAYGGVRGDTAR